jgi:prepilin-type N-terminal cleavage/methylation domain-containing protein
MLTRMRRRLQGDEGMSLIEVLVGMFVVAIVLSASAATTITALAAISSDEYQTRASALGNEIIEDLRALPWELVGFYDSDPAATATFEGATTVEVPDVGSPDARVPVAGPRTVTTGGLPFTVTTNIVWQAQGSNPEAMKRFVVDLAWSTRGRARTMRVEGVRAPTLDEREAGVVTGPVTFEIAEYNLNPQTMELTPSGTTREAIEVRVLTTSSASSVTLLYETNAGTASATLFATNASRTIWVQTLSSGLTTFNTGTYDFTVRAVNASGTVIEDTKAVTFVAPDATAIVIGEISRNRPVCVRQGNGNRNVLVDVILQASVTGIQAGDTVRFSWTNDNGGANGVLVAGSNPPTYQATITAASGHKFRAANTTLLVEVRRGSDQVAAGQALTVPVATATSASGCPT